MDALVQVHSVLPGYNICGAYFLIFLRHCGANADAKARLAKRTKKSFFVVDNPLPRKPEFLVGIASARRMEFAMHPRVAEAPPSLTHMCDRPFQSRADAAASLGQVCKLLEATNPNTTESTGTPSLLCFMPGVVLTNLQNSTKQGSSGSDWYCECPCRTTSQQFCCLSVHWLHMGGAGN